MNTEDIRKLADRLMAHPHPSDCDHLHDAANALRACADVVEAAEAHNGSGQTKYALNEALDKLEALEP